MAVLVGYVTDPFIVVGMPLGIYWIRQGRSLTRVNDRSLPPVKEATPTIANSITTDSASTSNLHTLVGLFCVLAFAVMLAILNPSTAPKVTPSPVQPLAPETGNQGNSSNPGNQSATSFLLPSLGIDEKQVSEATGSHIQVARVHSGSPAERAGLQAGGTILLANGYLTRAPGNLAWIINHHSPNGTVTLNVRQAASGQETTITATLH
jgi:hypothetical protein